MRWTLRLLNGVRLVSHGFAANPGNATGLILLFLIANNEQLRDAGQSATDVESVLDLAYLIAAASVAGTFIYLSSLWSGRFYVDLQYLTGSRDHSGIKLAVLHLVPSFSLACTVAFLAILLPGKNVLFWQALAAVSLISVGLIILHYKSGLMLQRLLLLMVAGGTALVPTAAMLHTGSGNFGIVSIVLSGILLWAGLFNLTYCLFKYKWRIPTLVPVIGVFLFSYIVRPQDPYKVPLAHPAVAPSGEDYIGSDLQTHFLAWLHSRFDPKGSGPIPVLLIAAEGGGIRAGYWASRVLAVWNENTGGLSADNTYAYSGVSGGSLGVAAFVEARNASKSPSGVSKCIDRFFASDLLSPLGAALFIAEPLRSVFPGFFENFRRDQVFERQLAAKWKDSCGNDAFSQIFALDKISEKWTAGPVLVFNATVLESGRQLAIANVYNLSDNTVEWFHQYSRMRRPQLTLAEAVHLSARFPLVAPPASLYTGYMKNTIGTTCTEKYDPTQCVISSERIGTVVDGGYVDNTGTQSLLGIYKALSRLRDRPEQGVSWRINVRHEDTLALLNRVSFHIFLLTTKTSWLKESLSTPEEDLRISVSPPAEILIAGETLLAARQAHSELTVLSMVNEVGNGMKFNECKINAPDSAKPAFTTYSYRRCLKYSDSFDSIDLDSAIDDYVENSMTSFNAVSDSNMEDRCLKIYERNERPTARTQPPLGWVLSRPAYDHILCGAIGSPHVVAEPMASFYDAWQANKVTEAHR